MLFQSFPFRGQKEVLKIAKHVFRFLDNDGKGSGV